jgi:D-threo-aldose 1-dehydrogenase
VQYRKFGRSGLDVSEIVFGGGWVGGILIHKDDETKRMAIKRAMEAGINWVDTAPSYGDGKSEEALGWLLNELDEQPFLSTKVMLDLQRLDDIAGQVERSLEKSFTRLRRSSVDLVFLHNAIAPESDDKRIGVAEMLGAGGLIEVFERAREEGLTRLIGISALGEAPALREVIASGRLDAAQVYYNLLNPSAGEDMPPAWTGHNFAGVIAACRAADVAVMNIRAFAAGVIATDQRTGREVVITDETKIAEEERKARAVFEALGHAYGTRAQTAIRFSLANRDIACVAVGMAEYRHLEEAITAAEMGPLPDEALAKLRALYATDFGRV